MLAYVFWHRPAAGVDSGRYEAALARLHRSLAHRPPSGFRGSGAFRIEQPAWLADSLGGDPPAGDCYEDWYLLDGWSAVGVLEEAAVARGHRGAHDTLAGLAGAGAGAVYRLSEGHARLDAASVAVWVVHPAGRTAPTIADLLADGMDRERAGLWRRCLVLGPAPEHCLLAPEPPAGVSASRLPAGRRATISPRTPLLGG